MKWNMLCAVLVFALACPSLAGALDLEKETADQHAALSKQMADRSWCDRVASQVAHPAALILEEDRSPADVVIRRTRALLDHIRQMPGCADLAGLSSELVSLESAVKSTPLTDDAARRELYMSACKLRRRIAFSNPLLDFDRLLFLTKHRPYRGDQHMVDQYCGFNAKPGGSLYVLDSPWSDDPKASDLMAASSVANGRLKDQALRGGAFNTLELDYDGQSIAFAYSECGPMPDSPDWSLQPPDWNARIAKQKKHEHYYWSAERTYNLFDAKLVVSDDGVEVTNLRQLIDSAYNEFDPCYLPNGRLVFMSERRGGYLRCGGNRPNPTYTLHSMERDGGDIVTLSYHETQEWNPSVDKDGMIAYTRWDYVDRDNDGAHHLWLCYPDGRDPRSLHGNYPESRESRPWLEIGIRAIPNSHKYVAVAGPHHGYAYGSLVLIDQTLEDDGAMNQLRRITPEAHLPESEQAPGLPHRKGKHSPRGEVYGTPWPLSEEFHLCVYDSRQKDYGIYLVDVFGNKELIWKDPEVACLDPIPLRPRPRPPVIQPQTTQHLADRSPMEPDTATVVVMNVYESDFDWPEGVRVKSLRVIELHLKDTWHMNEPMVAVGKESLVRGVIGEAPVEEDGSAYFEMPAGKPVYFQAIDEKGLAVQSMRSLTYLHRGEQLTCVGCHEPKRQAPRTPSSMTMALRRGPSKLKAPFAHANPISYPQLIQPVLDCNCAGCHQKPESKEKGAPLLGSHMKGRLGWSESYVSLAPKLWSLKGANGSIFENGMRSTPGQVGARASDLWKMIEKGHHDLSLSAKDQQRLIVWLDLNSNYFGKYLLEK